jgi:ribosomal protein L9
MEYIESQKSINNHYSIYDKALQDNVLGGFVFRKGVIDANEITAENGQIIEVDTMPNERIDGAFGRIPVANVPQDSLGYSQGLVNMVRQVAGASNVQIGMSDYAGQSGKQTEMLINRAKENSSDSAMLFNEFKREQANIMFLFAKFFYDNEAFTLIDHGINEDHVKSYMGNNDGGKFNGTEYLEDDVMIDIQVGSAPSFSEFTNLELLGLMVQSGQLPFEVYLSMLPDGYVSNREELKKLAENNSNKIIQQLQQELEQAKNVMEQMAKAYEQTAKDRDNIDIVVRENANLKSMLAEQTAQAIKSVAEMSQKNQEMMMEMQNVLKAIGRQQKNNKN